jgi:flavin-dependent dehydrogenase
MRSGASTVEVVGAGPAGLTAAITAARAGARVIVYERARQVGSRFHGDFQGLENWTTDGDVLAEVAGLGVEPTFPHAPIRQQVASRRTGRSWSVARRSPSITWSAAVRARALSTARCGRRRNRSAWTSASTTR